MDASILYIPSAIGLGALHALEPGHAKTLTAAYLIGTKGTKRDAILLGLAVAFTHSIVVIVLAALGVWLGKDTFTSHAMYWLQVGSGLIVIALGSYLLYRRWPRPRKLRALAFEPVMQGAFSAPLAAGHAHGHTHDHTHSHDHHHHDHSDMDEDEHARAHAATLPDYVRRGERPTAIQIFAFGAAGGMIPCPAAVTVMLLAVSINKVGSGLLMVLGFSIGLALALVGIGLAVVMGLSTLSGSGKFAWLSRSAPLISSSVVILSGLAAVLVTLLGGHAHG